MPSADLASAGRKGPGSDFSSLEKLEYNHRRDWAGWVTGGGWLVCWLLAFSLFYKFVFSLYPCLGRTMPISHQLDLLSMSMWLPCHTVAL